MPKCVYWNNKIPIADRHKTNARRNKINIRKVLYTIISANLENITNFMEKQKVPNRLGINKVLKDYVL
ncbi:15010_t:CDS:2 [Dentiscutata erythropus]|uniref:15010_t:CDS:1 n=1 Tax=Dentiscutata erythropus TaxID=1348616 RepID=A0A9N8WKC5_9GLOM|nr:15010_t:CDS:2 [Dentiscutata erythropus]